MHAAHWHGPRSSTLIGPCRTGSAGNRRAVSHRAPQIPLAGDMRSRCSRPRAASGVQAPPLKAKKGAQLRWRGRPWSARLSDGRRRPQGGGARTRSAAGPPARAEMSPPRAPAPTAEARGAGGGADHETKKAPRQCPALVPRGWSLPPRKGKRAETTARLRGPRRSEAALNPVVPSCV